MISNQEAFDRIWRHFVTEGNPYGWEDAEGEGWGCRYLTSDGRRCAIGCLIPLEALRDLALDTMTPSTGELYDMSEVESYLPEDPKLAFDAQATHDRCARIDALPKVFEFNLRRLAEKHNLTVPGDG